MYCKKCGRKLKDGMRYCDRCGLSVNQSKKGSREAREIEIQELKQERINRKEKLQKKETKKKRINKRHMNILSAAFIILFCILIIAVIAYKVTIDKSQNEIWRTKDGSVEMNATSVPAATPAPTDKNGNTVTPVPTATAYALTGEINSDGYRVFDCGNSLTVQYPATFEKQRVNENEKLNVYDNSGGASIIVGEESASSLQAKQLMTEYTNSQTGKVSYSRAGSGWYIVETSENDIICHRKAIIVNNKIVYYDFTYSTTSSSASTYKGQIEYMDKNFSL